MEHIEISIRDFARYIKRGDIKTPNWFAIEHNLLLHPDFFGVTGDEVKAFIWVIGTAAHLNLSTIRVYLDVCASQIQISKKSVRSCIEKLSTKRWDVTDPSRVCTGNFGPSCTTVEDSTGENSTVHNREGNILGSPGEPEQHPLIQIWNEHRGELPAVIKTTVQRNKKIEKTWSNLTAAEWVTVIKKIAASDFCNGRTDSGDWKAGFDWLLSYDKNKTPNYLKVQEGNYDNAKSRSSKTNWDDSAQKVLTAIRRFGSQNPDEAKAFLGDELLAQVRAIGGLSRIGAMPATEFTAKQIAKLLRSAELSA